MISEMNHTTYNFSTGPVIISPEVQLALAAPAISHRSKEFGKLYNDTRDYLCKQFNTRDVFIISGSGTVANEAMMWQIKMQGRTGLILSNGEFGLRLIEQARRTSLNFLEHSLMMGKQFDVSIIKTIISQHKINWVLFCHCETSTGVINDLEKISAICAANNSLCFVDCMSTVGTYSLDLSQITMATASSGKGLGSVPGLGIIFSNKEISCSPSIPLYLDLGYYKKKDGIPFTISSNLLNPLYVSIRQKLNDEYFGLIHDYSNECWRMLRNNNLLPFCNRNSKVFTLSSHRNFISKLKAEHILISYESEYLLKRDFCQIAFFGYYSQSDLNKLTQILNEYPDSIPKMKDLVTQ
jgi:aspartate aminotransferase-like enzyme